MYAPESQRLIVPVHPRGLPPCMALRLAAVSPVRGRSGPHMTATIETIATNRTLSIMLWSPMCPCHREVSTVRFINIQDSSIQHGTAHDGALHVTQIGYAHSSDYSLIHCEPDES